MTVKISYYFYAKLYTRCANRLLLELRSNDSLIFRTTYQWPYTRRRLHFVWEIADNLSFLTSSDLASMWRAHCRIRIYSRHRTNEKRCRWRRGENLAHERIENRITEKNIINNVVAAARINRCLSVTRTAIIIAGWFSFV